MRPAVTTVALLLQLATHPLLAQPVFTVQHGGPLAEQAVGVVSDGTVFRTLVQRHDAALGPVTELMSFNAQGAYQSTSALAPGGRCFVQALEPVSGGGAVAVGARFAPGGTDLDPLVVRLSASYTISWTLAPAMPAGQVLQAATVLTDGSIVATGTTSGPEKHDVLVMRVSSAGNLLWSTTIPGALDEEGTGIAADATGIMVTGRQMNYGGSPDCYFARLDMSGNVAWTTAWGGIRDDVGTSLQRASGGYFVMLGWTRSHALYDHTLGDWPIAPYLIAIDTNGDTLWTRAIADTLVERRAHSLAIASNGDLFIGGTARDLATGEDAAMVLRTTSTGGPIWEKQADAGRQEEVLQVRALPTGAVACGRVFGPAAQQVLLIRTDALGN